jgi:hypothetical protein
MRHIFFVVHERRGLHSRRHSPLWRPLASKRAAGPSRKIGIHDDLAVVAQVHRFELVELLPPLLHMRHVGFIALQVIPEPRCTSTSPLANRRPTPSRLPDR